MEVVLTEDNFESEVLTAEGTVLVDFWAQWCGPCQMLAPIVEEIAKEGKVKVGKVDVDDQPQLAGQFSINVIPTVMIFKNGKIVNQSVGYCSKEALEALLRASYGKKKQVL